MRTNTRVLGVLVLLTASLAHAKATVLIFNGDPPGTGFNDPTVVAPVGGNPGTTLGAQRLAVFEAAAAIWGDALDSPVPIKILAHFTPLQCDNTGAVLGSAGPSGFLASDPPLADGSPAPTDAGLPNTVFPRQATWYVPAMIERILGQSFFPEDGGTDENNYDIVANFNSTLDSDPASCNGFLWYYGLDAQHGDKEDLLTVVLHEFGHGLGFTSITDPSTGEFPVALPDGGTYPDVWAYFLFDETTGKHWVQLDAAGRRASATSQALVWDGPAVRAGVPGVTGVGPLLRVTSAPATPSAVKDYTDVGLAQFGAPATDAGVSGQLGIGSTGYGCSALGRLAPLDGRIAVLDRGGPDGGCTFVEKARNAQDAGAIGLLVANNVAGIFGPGGTAPDVEIPVLMITQTEGLALKSAIGAGPVQGTILRDALVGLHGVDSANRVPMFAPPQLRGGSSVSHWDESVFPNLLMEPAINPDLNHTLDLTTALLRDIGWFAVDLGITGSGPSTLGSGQQGTFTFTVTNPGPSSAPAVTVSNALSGLDFVSNTGACSTGFPCALGDLGPGESRTITTVLKSSSGNSGTTTATVASSANFNPTNDSAALTVNAGVGGGGKSGCTSTGGAPSPWLALLGLLAFVRRRRTA